MEDGHMIEEESYKMGEDGISYSAADDRSSPSRSRAHSGMSIPNNNNLNLPKAKKRSPAQGAKRARYVPKDTAL